MAQVFTCIVDTTQRDMIETAYTAISELQLWTWLSQLNMSVESFMLLDSDRKHLNEIYDYIAKMPNDPGHSGSTFCITMRHMREIAVNGLDAYLASYLASCPA